MEKLPARKRIALIAHDHRKADLLEWAGTHREALARHDLYATGTTGRILAESLNLDVTASCRARWEEISRLARASPKAGST